MITLLIYIIGLQIAFLYSFLGPILTLLRNAFTIDAIGHSIVFGIALGFLFSHSLESPFLLACAVLSAFLMILINEYLKKNGISPDASLGISFSLLFSIGILLISLYAKNIHLDLDMILLGNIEYSLYDQILIFGYGVPKIIFWLSGGIIFFLFFIAVFFNHIQMMVFDEEFAKIKQIPFRLISFLFIIFFTLIIVFTFQAMGSLLLLGIAVAPFGFSWRTAGSYFEFIKESVFLSLLSGGIGVMISLFINTSIAATLTFSVTSCSLLGYFLRKNK
jgi:manganese/zinc/iron transport system permease protein